MSISFTVTGHFANGQRRVAGLHWPGGSNKFDFKRRSEQFSRVFRSQIQDVPLTLTGMPKFEYIEVSYQKYEVSVTKEYFYFAITPKALDKLRKTYAASPNTVNQSMSNKPVGKVVDMTKFTNPNSFWTRIRGQVDALYKQVFSNLM